jgi:hypothetical protein
MNLAYLIPAAVSMFSSFMTLVLVMGIPVWGWVRWFKHPEVGGILPFASLLSLALDTLSVLIVIGGFVRSLINPVMLYFDPVLQRMVGLGLLTSLLALFCAVCGVWRKNPVRWHALSLSVLTLVLWFGAGVSM